MPNIYRVFAKEPSGLFISDLMIASEYCYVEGSMRYNLGTKEFEKRISLARKNLAQSGFDASEIEEEINRLKKLAPIVEPSGFHGISYFASFDGEGGTIQLPKRVLLDKTVGMAAEITVDNRRVDVFRVNVENVMDIWGKHARKFPQIRVSYDGTLADALAEFYQKGFEFYRWDAAWDAYCLKNGEKTEDLENAVVNRTTIDEIFSKEIGPTIS